MRTDVKPTADTFAKAVGLNPRTVRRLVADGQLPRGATLGEWIGVYTQRLRDEADTRMAASDLPGERARLARAQAERIEMQNTEMQGELAPVETLDTARRYALDAVAVIVATVAERIAAEAPHLAGELKPLSVEVERALLLLREG
jgi:terminase small subunit / prophage DNA-packing protein